MKNLLRNSLTKEVWYAVKNAKDVMPIITWEPLLRILRESWLVLAWVGTVLGVGCFFSFTIPYLWIPVSILAVWCIAFILGIVYILLPRDPNGMVRRDFIFSDETHYRKVTIWVPRHLVATYNYEKDLQSVNTKMRYVSHFTYNFIIQPFVRHMKKDWYGRIKVEY